MKWLDSISDPMDMNLSQLWEIVKDREAWGHRVRTDLVTEQQQIDMEKYPCPASLSASIPSGP